MPRKGKQPTRVKAVLLKTGTVARRMGVSQQTVIRWIDLGILPGVRIPGSKFRVVRPEDAKKFAEDNGLPWIEEPT